jgi:transposase
MSLKEADRLGVMKQVDTKKLNLRRASEELGVSIRQVKRTRKRYLKDGAIGLISRHRGKVSPNRTDPEQKAAALKILQSDEFAGFGPSFAKEKLKERHGYAFSNETLRKWMIESGLWKSKKARTARVHQRRVRRSRFGELLQGDGSRHAWFEFRGEECTLVIFVDDATSQLTAGKFVKAETTVAYQEILEEHLNCYGKPLALYVDKHSIFRVSRETHGNTEKETHFARVLRDLDIELICAHSPQAKGRVERANGTLEDRLIKEMRLRGISNIEEGNEFLPEFIKDYNQRFGKVPRSQENAHREFKEADGLERLFAKRQTRKLSKSLSFHYEGVYYQLEPKYPKRHRSTHVTILERPGKPLLVESGGREQPYSIWGKAAHEKPKILDNKELEAHWSNRSTKKPGRKHPWR